MKKLILFFVVIFAVSFAYSQKSPKYNLDKAISSCKKISEKDIQDDLKEKSPKELLNAQYESVKEYVISMLNGILSEYKASSKKNSKKMDDKEFKIPLKDGEAKESVLEYLNEYREWMLEEREDHSELDSAYIKKITQDVLREHYIETLCKGLELYVNEWLDEEYEDDYIPFLKEQTVHPKIITEKMIQEMGGEYLENKKEEITKLLSYLFQTHDIIKEYQVGEVEVKTENKKDFSYISTLEKVFHQAVSGGKVKVPESKMESLWEKIIQSIIKDIKNHIETSTGIKN